MLFSDTILKFCEKDPEKGVHASSSIASRVIDTVETMAIRCCVSRLQKPQLEQLISSLVNREDIHVEGELGALSPSISIPSVRIESPAAECQVELGDPSGVSLEAGESGSMHEAGGLPIDTDKVRTLILPFF